MPRRFPYVELHARSAFSFLRGASRPEDLAREAARLGLPGLALCDRDGVYGIPRFHAAAREAGIRALVGTEITLEDGSILPVLVETREGYQNLCRLLSEAKLRSPKGEARVRWAELEEAAPGLLALTGDEEGPLLRTLARGEDPRVPARRLLRLFGPDRLFVELQRSGLRGDRFRTRRLAAVARELGLPVVATGGVLYAKAEERLLLDVFHCLRAHTTLEAAGSLLSANDQRHLRSPQEMAALFADLPEAIEESARIASRIDFSLEDLGYRFPRYPTPAGESEEEFLEGVVWAEAPKRYGSLSPAVRRQLQHELEVIRRLGFAGYFLIVWDLVRWCTREGMLVQGRGSAANSAVCYSLGITTVDPVGSRLLFERFLSEGRKGWPDIDLDLPSGEARERVIQEVYRRYGRRGAAMTASVICFQGRSAARDLGKVLSLPTELLDRFSALFPGGDYPHTLSWEEHGRQSGLSPADPRQAAFLRLYPKLLHLPRHLGQHPGGMVIAQGELDRIVPLENAAMPGRSVLQWDKDDCEELGMVKIDLLGLGMIAVIEEAAARCRSRGLPVDIARLPKDDSATFALLERAETVGVFQVESRAQMSILPRLRPRCFYDLVVQVAIVRPGPIHGGLIGRYLARRCGREPIRYPDPRLAPILERTLGIVLFQEQALQIAMVLGGFSAAQAEELRRALGFRRDPRRMEQALGNLAQAMRARGIAPSTIEWVARSLSSFALYGFPESHAIAWAGLAYASAYLKAHHGPEFYAALLNHQPMGFYSPDTLIQEGKRRGIRFRPISVLASEDSCTIEEDGSVRLGLRLARGLSGAARERILSARAEAPFRSLEEFRRRVRLSRKELRLLASLGAFQGLAAHRREALWQLERPLFSEELFPGPTEGPSPLSPMTPPERLQADYAGTGITLGPHPMTYLRPRTPAARKAADLRGLPHGMRVQVAGAVICRQRPGTAKGFLFLSLEDETGIANVIIPPDLFEARRLLLSVEPFLLAEGILEKVRGHVQIRGEKIACLPSPGLPRPGSHDFR
ncbi:Error-prone DNA polymerase [Methylacidimicrobium sp. AP8]|uniref:DNA polymerase III subunit alpha n=1 Tax=Methylacidimicrobium sp. AP8 TaxID=2730359 RepID=UPI0018BFE2D0|nr:error-prone DNA polymerase [Methylacidimicrobium sp. AP8]CAB4244130.1 Error-prone DNA polymerase [Methylacidimicrobium sp. AP8]